MSRVLQPANWSCGLVCAVLMLAQAAIADEAADLQELLSRPIIGPNQALAEVQDYTEARVPRMPAVSSVAAWEKLANTMRQEVLSRVVYQGEAAAWREARCAVEWLDTIAGGPGYSIRKLRYEALPGMWIPALLYVPDNLAGKVPVVLNVNGHDGNGKAAGYKQIRCINLAKRGMLALNVEWVGMGQLRNEDFRHSRMNQLDLCGTSGLAPYYLSMKRGLDILLAHANADPARVAVAGLSGGGWQTIIISALDTRVSLCNPVAGYSSFLTRVRNFSDLGDSEQTPVDLATAADYNHLTAMLAPRAALLTYNIKDNCCFASGHALPPLLEAAGPIYKLYGQQDRLRSHINEDPGTHNFERDNREAFYRMVRDQFFAGSAEFDAKELPTEGEIKTKDELNVQLPDENLGFHSLALRLSNDLPRNSQIPLEHGAAEAWRNVRRGLLEHLVRAKNYQVVAQPAGSEKQGEIQATFWRLRVGDAWTVPAVELTRGDAKGTTLLLADEGRAKVSAQIAALLQSGQRVVAVDPFYFGESKIAQKDWLFGLLVSAVGDRPLGLQASQVAAVSRWLAGAGEGQRRLGPVRVLADGPRTGLITLVAAGLEPNAIGDLQLNRAFKSLKEILEQNRSVEQAPELFCFGLLRDFDVPQLTALAAPRKVVISEVK